VAIPLTATMSDLRLSDAAAQPAGPSAVLAAPAIATCEDCQGLLRDAATFDAVMSEAAPAAAVAPASPAEPAPIPTVPAPVVDDVVPIATARAARRKQWPIIAMAVGLAAVAALAVWIKIPRSADLVAINLPAERALEPRFTGDHFDHYRPYAPLRGDHAREDIPLATLAELERAHRTADLIAALAATGNLARAHELAAQRTDVDADTDRAALALAAGDPGTALELAARALATRSAQPSAHAAGPPAAWWNFALAARELRLPRVSRDAFRKVAALHEPGWSDEATRQIAALDRALDPAGAAPDELRRRADADQQAGKPALAKAERDEAALLEASSK